MANIYVYIRVSTQHQDYSRQMGEIKRYFAAHGLDFNNVTAVYEEKKSGGKSYNDRVFRSMMDVCKRGDFVYAASTDRIGRNWIDMVNLMAEAKERGIAIIACKNGLSLIDDSMATRLILSITAMMDEDERHRIKDRAISTAEMHRELVATQGGWTSKSGRFVTHPGNDAGYDMTAVQQAAAEAHRNAKNAWMNNSVAVKFVAIQIAKGYTLTRILQEFQAMERIDPSTYATRTGRPMNLGTLSDWAKWIKKHGLDLTA